MLLWTSDELHIHETFNLKKCHVWDITGGGPLVQWLKQDIGRDSCAIRSV